MLFSSKFSAEFEETPQLIQPNYKDWTHPHLESERVGQDRLEKIVIGGSHNGQIETQ